jgi:hypothetical protein
MHHTGCTIHLAHISVYVLILLLLQVERKAGIVYKPQRSPAWCDRVLYRSNLPLKQVGAVQQSQCNHSSAEQCCHSVGMASNPGHGLWPTAAWLWF